MYLAQAYKTRRLSKLRPWRDNLNRWYDPAVGRWISKDPIGFNAGEANLYRYVGNAPTNAIDPNGLVAEAKNGEVSFEQTLSFVRHFEVTFRGKKYTTLTMGITDVTYDFDGRVVKSCGEFPWRIEASLKTRADIKVRTHFYRYWKNPIKIPLTRPLLIIEAEGRWLFRGYGEFPRTQNRVMSTITHENLHAENFRTQFAEREGNLLQKLTSTCYHSREDAEFELEKYQTGLKRRYDEFRKRESRHSGREWEKYMETRPSFLQFLKENGRPPTASELGEPTPWDFLPTTR